MSARQARSAPPPRSFAVGGDRVGGGVVAGAAGGVGDGVGGGFCGGITASERVGSVIVGSVIEDRGGRDADSSGAEDRGDAVIESVANRQ
jgi:hypothetical protein